MWRALFGRDKAPDPAPAGQGPPAKPFGERMTDKMAETSWAARRGGGRLPVAVLPQLGRIEDVVYPFLSYVRANPLTAEEEVAVEGIIGDYLPTTLNTFLALDPRIANQRRSDGRTAGDDVLDQLETLEDAIRDVSKAVYEHDAQQLAIQGRFLNTKFSRSDLDL